MSVAVPDRIVQVMPFLVNSGGQVCVDVYSVAAGLPLNSTSVHNPGPPTIELFVFSHILAPELCRTMVESVPSCIACTTYVVHGQTTGEPPGLDPELPDDPDDPSAPDDPDGPSAPGDPSSDEEEEEVEDGEVLSSLQSSQAATRLTACVFVITGSVGTACAPPSV